MGRCLFADPADPVEFFEPFRKVGANVVHVESRGSHAISLMLDSKARNALEDAWCSGIFSNVGILRAVLF